MPNCPIVAPGRIWGNMRNRLKIRSSVCAAANHAFLRRSGASRDLSLACAAKLIFRSLPGIVTPGFSSVGVNGMLILCLLWGTADASVQPLERIAGEVVDEATGKPLPGATVMLMGTRSGAIGDQEGLFVIPQVAPGRHLLRVSMVGYRAEEVTVTVPQRQALQVRLHAQALVEEEVVITATRTSREEIITGIS